MKATFYILLALSASLFSFRPIEKDQLRFEFAKSDCSDKTRYRLIVLTTDYAYILKYNEFTGRVEDVRNGYQTKKFLADRTRCAGTFYLWCGDVFKIKIMTATAHSKVNNATTFNVRIHKDGAPTYQVTGLKFSEEKEIHLP